MLRLREVEELVGLKHTRIYQLLAEGRFPRPIRQSPKNVRWFSDEIDAYIEALRAQRDQAAA
jgi:prophage regulatory protein